MFGHKAGSFTGALKDKKGLFEEAHNGTIFLDEIGEMAFELQAKLLRILETGEYIKIGDTKPTRVNVRIMLQRTATCRKKSKRDVFVKICSIVFLYFRCISLHFVSGQGISVFLQQLLPRAFPRNFRIPLVR